MRIYNAPYYTESDIAQLDTLQFPYSDKEATYVGLDHQYELTSKYFEERGVNLEKMIEGTNPDKVKNFLHDLRVKFYLKIYNTNKSTRSQINYMIAKRGLRGYNMFEYRQAVLEAMFIEGCYLLDNGDISGITGVDLDTMQNMSADVIRGQERDFHPDCINALKTLGLRFYGKYTFIPQGQGETW